MIVNLSTKSKHVWERAQLINETDSHIEVSVNGRKKHAYIHKSSLSTFKKVSKVYKVKPKKAIIHYKVCGRKLQQYCEYSKIDETIEIIESTGAKILRTEIL